MVYEPQKLEVVQAKAGDRVDGVVTQIQEGTLKDFLSPDQLEKWTNCKPEDPAICVVVSLADGKGEKSQLFRLPTDNVVSPRSNLAKWKKSYGEFPTVEQKVFLLYNTEGFLNFVL